MIQSGNYEFNSWWVNHNQSFVSHATNNYMRIFDAKTVRCAEEIFRLEGSVEHQVGCSRVVSKQFNSGANSNAYQEIVYNTHREDYPNCTIIPDFALDSGVLKQLEKAYPDHAIEDHETYVKFFIRLECVDRTYTPIYDTDCLRSRSSPKESDKQITAMHRPIGSSFFQDKIKRTYYRDDELTGRKIDASLRDIYQDCLEEGFCKNRIAYELNGLRNAVFGSIHNCLDSIIEVEKRGVLWAYGNIAILIGNARPRLAWEGLFSDPCSDKTVFRFKAPFQEKSFHTLSLEEPSMIIVGKEEAIEKAKSNPNIDPAIKARLVALNTLTEEQRAVLQ